MDIQVLSASQLALVIRLNVFMDNHQTQGYILDKNYYHRHPKKLFQCPKTSCNV